MITVYKDPSGRTRYNRPTAVSLNGRTYSPPTDDILFAAGWKIVNEIDPIRKPDLPTVEELVEEAIRRGMDGGRTYSINQEFEIQRKRDTDRASFDAYYQRVEAAIEWANAQPHRVAEEGE